MPRKSAAEHILEARRNYTNLPSGFVDETDLLLMSQIAGEKRVAAEARAKKKKKGKRGAPSAARRKARRAAERAAK